MTYSDKVELVALAKHAMSTPIGENGIDLPIVQLVHPGAESSEDLDMNDVCTIMYIEGYLRCKKESEK